MAFHLAGPPSFLRFVSIYDWFPACYVYMFYVFLEFYKLFFLQKEYDFNQIIYMLPNNILSSLTYWPPIPLVLCPIFRSLSNKIRDQPDNIYVTTMLLQAQQPLVLIKIFKSLSNKIRRRSDNIVVS